MSSPTMAPRMSPVPREYVNEVDQGAIVGTVFIIVTILFLAGFYFYTKYAKKKQFKSSIFSRFEKFGEFSFSKISIVLIVAFLVSEVISGFNRAIMLPVVQVMFPDQSIWAHAVDLGRGAYMYPGLFLQALMSFILSIIIIFMIAEMVYQITSISNAKTKKIIKYVFIIIGVSLILGLIVWNIVDILEPNKKYLPLDKSNTNAINIQRSSNPYSIRFF